MDAVIDILIQYSDIIGTFLATVLGLRFVPDWVNKYLLKTQKAIDAIDEVTDAVRDKMKEKTDA